MRSIERTDNEGDECGGKLDGKILRRKWHVWNGERRSKSKEDRKMYKKRPGCIHLQKGSFQHRCNLGQRGSRQGSERVLRGAADFHALDVGRYNVGGPRAYRDSML